MKYDISCKDLALNKTNYPPYLLAAYSWRWYSSAKRANKLWRPHGLRLPQSLMLGLDEEHASSTRETDTFFHNNFMSVGFWETCHRKQIKLMRFHTLISGVLLKARIAQQYTKKSSGLSLSRMKYDKSNSFTLNNLTVSAKHFQTLLVMFLLHIYTTTGINWLL